MTKGKHHDRDVWSPPSPKAGAPDSSPPPISKFQQHFQDRMSRLGRDDANVLAGAAPTTSSSALSPPSASPNRGETGAAAKPRTSAAASTAHKPKIQRTAFMTPDEVRGQQRAEALRKQNPPQPARQPPQEKPVMQKATKAKVAPSPPPDATDVGAARADLPTDPKKTESEGAAPATAQTVDDFLEQLRQQAEQRDCACATPHVTGPPTTRRLTPTTPPLQRRPNSGQRLAPLPVTSTEPAPPSPATSAASARSTPAAQGHAHHTTPKQSVDLAMRGTKGSDNVVTKSRWAAPSPARQPKTVTTTGKKGESSVAVKPVIDSRSPPAAPSSSPASSTSPKQEGSNVLRLATPKAVSIPKRQHSSHTTAPASRESASGSATKQRVSYTPYSVDDYNAMMEKIAHEKRGGLGPSDTDAQRLARERLERQRAYGKLATKHALEVLKADAEAEVENDPTKGEENASATTVSENSSTHTSPRDTGAPASAEEGGEEDGEIKQRPPQHSSASSSTAPGKKHRRKVLRQPTPEKVVQARERRHRALEYAREKTIENAQPAQPSSEQRDCISVAHEVEPATRPPVVDKAAIAREQRRLDLEAKHEQQKLAVERIRKQLRA